MILIVRVMSFSSLISIVFLLYVVFHAHILHVFNITQYALMCLFSGCDLKVTDHETLFETRQQRIERGVILLYNWLLLPSLE
jgi:hypothetical protein